jgi:hypothetical protein
MQFEIVTEDDKTHTLRETVANVYGRRSVKGLTTEQAVDLKRILEAVYHTGIHTGLRDATKAIHELTRQVEANDFR